MHNSIRRRNDVQAMSVSFPVPGTYLRLVIKIHPTEPCDGKKAA
ncbi:MAG: hypothetical protein ABIU30_03345 [Ferruginibacter sp.]